MTSLGFVRNNPWVQRDRRQQNDNSQNQNSSAPNNTSTNGQPPTSSNNNDNELIAKNLLSLQSAPKNSLSLQSAQSLLLSTTTFTGNNDDNKSNKDPSILLHHQEKGYIAAAAAAVEDEEKEEQSESLNGGILYYNAPNNQKVLTRAPKKNNNSVPSIIHHCPKNNSSHSENHQKLSNSSAAAASSSSAKTIRNTWASSSNIFIVTTTTTTSASDKNNTYNHPENVPSQIPNFFGRNDNKGIQLAADGFEDKHYFGYEERLAAASGGRNRQFLISEEQVGQHPLFLNDHQTDHYQEEELMSSKNGNTMNSGKSNDQSFRFQPDFEAHLKHGFSSETGPDYTQHSASSEVAYGPGIVRKLRDKFLLLAEEAEREAEKTGVGRWSGHRHSMARKAQSLESLLDGPAAAQASKPSSELSPFAVGGVVETSYGSHTVRSPHHEQYPSSHQNNTPTFYDTASRYQQRYQRAQPNYPSSFLIEGPRVPSNLLQSQYHSSNTTIHQMKNKLYGSHGNLLSSHNSGYSLPQTNSGYSNVGGGVRRKDHQQPTTSEMVPEVLTRPQQPAHHQIRSSSKSRQKPTKKSLVVHKNNGVGSPSSSSDMVVDEDGNIQLPKLRSFYVPQSQSNNKDGKKEEPEFVRAQRKLRPVPLEQTSATDLKIKKQSSRSSPTLPPADPNSTPNLHGSLRGQNLQLNREINLQSNSSAQKPYQKIGNGRQRALNNSVPTVNVASKLRQDSVSRNGGSISGQWVEEDIAAADGGESTLSDSSIPLSSPSGSSELTPPPEEPIPPQPSQHHPAGVGMPNETIPFGSGGDYQLLRYDDKEELLYQTNYHPSRFVKEQEEEDSSADFKRPLRYDEEDPDLINVERPKLDGSLRISSAALNQPKTTEIHGISSFDLLTPSSTTDVSVPSVPSISDIISPISFSSVDEEKETKRDQKHPGGIGIDYCAVADEFESNGQINSASGTGLQHLPMKPGNDVGPIQTSHDGLAKEGKYILSSTSTAPAPSPPQNSQNPIIPVVSPDVLNAAMKHPNMEGILNQMAETIAENIKSQHSLKMSSTTDNNSNPPRPQQSASITDEQKERAVAAIGDKRGASHQKEETGKKSSPVVVKTVSFGTLEDDDFNAPKPMEYNSDNGLIENLSQTERNGSKSVGSHEIEYNDSISIEYGVRPLVSLIPDEDLEEFLSVIDEEFKFELEGDHGKIPPTGSILIKEKKQSKGRVGFSSEPIKAYAYQKVTQVDSDSDDEREKTRGDVHNHGLDSLSDNESTDSDRLKWNGGVEITDLEYIELCSQEKEEMLKERLLELELATRRQQQESSFQSSGLPSIPKGASLVNYVPNHVKELNGGNNGDISANNNSNQKSSAVQNGDKKSDNDDSAVSITHQLDGDSFSKTESASSDLLF